MLTNKPRRCLGFVFSYAAGPGPENYICIQPMAAVTDALNLSHAGKDVQVQTVAPG